MSRVGIPSQLAKTYFVQSSLPQPSSCSPGIIGAANNGFGTVGVAPDVELVAVKVLRDYGMGGAFSWVAAGIYYAVAHAKADIINMR